MQQATIIKGNIVFTKTPEKFEVFPLHYLVVENGRVEGIYSKVPEKYSSLNCTDYGNRLIIPGFVDLHLHGAQFLQRGAGMTKQLLDWLEDYTFDLESEFNDPQFAHSAYRAFVDRLVAYGTLRSCIFGTSSTEATEILFKLLQQKGVGAYVGKVNMDRNCPENIRETTEESLAGTRYLIEKFGDDPLVKPIITPRFAPTCSEELLCGLGELAQQHNLPVQSHLSENLAEVEWVKSLFEDAENYADVYFKNNLYGQTKTLMAHAIYLTEEEVQKTLETDPVLVHCPDSNLNVRSGIMPVREYLNLGLSIGLGSDIAGGHKIGLNEAMVRAIQLSKLITLENEALAPLSISEVYYMGTKGGGKFFGKVGSFEPDYSFDALVIKDDPMITNRYSLEDRLEKFIYTGDDRNIIARYVEGKRIDS